MLTAHCALITMAHLRSFGVRFGVVVMISHHGFHIRTHVHYLLLTHLFISYSPSCCHKLDSSTKYSLERGNVYKVSLPSVLCGILKARDSAIPACLICKRTVLFFLHRMGTKRYVPSSGIHGGEDLEPPAKKCSRHRSKYSGYTQCQVEGCKITNTSDGFSYKKFPSTAKW